MKNQEHSPIYRKDYTVPTYIVETIDLTFVLLPEKTVVTARSHLKLNPRQNNSDSSLRLNGEELLLKEVKVDGKTLHEKEYNVSEKSLEFVNLPAEFDLEITTQVNPNANISLSGLYRSNGNYCTQCEAEGFRKITYALDRPDVMSIYTVRIEADKKENPVLLANGNLQEKGDMDSNMHYAVWHDPHPKPSYLFALVAGNLVSLDDRYVTSSGRQVALQIFVEPRNSEKCVHAMRSLKKAMKWDESVFGLEYDLDRYMIVAVDDFNMGAMENKGLNVFNSKYVLASPETATDQDYLGIEGVIAHEYFHNWTGNRVTCRDWFQLSLKEGLTVFRDQEFSADMNSRPVQRIDDVNLLRNYQFREDSGPMSHSVRPDSYLEINNFYTVTIYNKGAEVVRMIRSLLGSKGFRAGMDLYFERHDGQAVTCDDFVSAMGDASGKDLSQFKRWYSQAGTPTVKVAEEWDDKEKSLMVTFSQSCPSTPGQDEKKPFHIPVQIGLLDSKGNDIDLRSSCQAGGLLRSKYLELKNEEESFTFCGFKEKPVLSCLRNFSAPVVLTTSQNKEELAFIMAHDTDLFNRWDAACRLGIAIILQLIEDSDFENFVLDKVYVGAFRECLVDEKGDLALIAQAITLPTENYIAQQMATIEPDLLYKARKGVMLRLREELLDEFKNVYARNISNGKYGISPEEMGQRSLKNSCLKYIMAGDAIEVDCVNMCLGQYWDSSNMTDTIGALSAIVNFNGKQRDEVFADFYHRWEKDPLVVDKWFALQATSSLENTLENVKELLQHPAFSIKNPNKVRSLIGAFCSGNHFRFHDSSGGGYRFLTEQILKLDPMNPQIAARLVSPFTSWKRYDKKRQVLMHEQLRYLSNQQSLSADVYEIVQKSL